MMRAFAPLSMVPVTGVITIVSVAAVPISSLITSLWPFTPALHAKIVSSLVAAVLLAHAMVESVVVAVSAAPDAIFRKLMALGPQSASSVPAVLFQHATSPITEVFG